MTKSTVTPHKMRLITAHCFAILRDDCTLTIKVDVMYMIL